MENFWQSVFDTNTGPSSVANRGLTFVFDIRHQPMLEQNEGSSSLGMRFVGSDSNSMVALQARKG
jgi:hypothetical protein